MDKGGLASCDSWGRKESDMLKVKVLVTQLCPDSLQTRERPSTAKKKPQKVKTILPGQPLDQCLSAP